MCKECIVGGEIQDKIYLASTVMSVMAEDYSKCYRLTENEENVSAGGGQIWFTEKVIPDLKESDLKKTGYALKSMI